ncbi:MAG: AraC family transcriptional regulator [Kiritimatiellae bacterium]|nr:AraC family transcriptional regulator [Kiritimatiellia bacterium]
MNGMRHPDPDILAVTEIRRHRPADARQGRSSIHCDVLSVWVKGGPRYVLDIPFTFSPPMAILVPSGTVQGDRRHGDIVGVFLRFHGKGLLAKDERREGHTVVAFGTGRVSVPFLKEVSHDAAVELTAILREIDAVAEPGPVGQMQRTALLLQAVALYCRAAPRAGATGVHREVLRLRQWIEKHALQNTPMTKAYAGLSLSPSHVAALFGKTYGTTPVAYRKQIRLRRARALLVSSPMNVEDVALAVGFSDPLYFSRVFRARYGAAPSTLIRDFESTRGQ